MKKGMTIRNGHWFINFHQTFEPSAMFPNHFIKTDDQPIFPRAERTCQRQLSTSDESHKVSKQNDRPQNKSQIVFAHHQILAYPWTTNFAEFTNEFVKFIKIIENLTK